MSLPEFLAEAELSHYLNALRNELKVTCVEHLKYVKEEDLEGIGMTRPEMRRLKKFYKKEHPQGTFGKLKRAIMRTGGGGEPSTRSLSPSPPEHRISRPISAVVRPPGRLLISPSTLSQHKTLGEGHFGRVQQAVWTTDNGEKVQVAVKTLNRDHMQAGSQEFLKDATELQALDHPHITTLYGVVMDNQLSPMLVTELAPSRSLLEMLKEPALRPDFPVPRLCDFAQQVCDAMSYLESKRLVHRGLSASNVLLFSNNCVKISDTGLSTALGAGREYYHSNCALSGKLPVAWCAPETFHSLAFTSATDIWAYGVTLWEFFTYGFQPWAGLSGQQVMEAVDEPECLRLEQPDLCPKELYAIMTKCWEHSPERRPTFTQLFLTLPQIRPVQVKAVRDYPSPTVEKDFLYYKNYDIIIVLDKSPSNAPGPGVWKGCLSSGKYGFFQPTNTVPYVEPKTSPIALPKTTLARKESGRNSKRSKLRTDMIGAPQNDLRHTGHIGYDGAVFGDVSFIGDNYDKLPAKGGKMDISRGSSLQSIPRNTNSPDRNGLVKSSASEDSLDKRNGYGHSWISQESLASADQHDGFMDGEDNSIFADFKMPDLTSSFDLGPSFMDEVLKALDEKEKQAEAASTPSPTFNGRDFGDDIDPNRVNLDDLTTPVAEEKTPLFEERGFSAFQEKTAVSRHSPPPLPPQPPRVETVKEKKQAKVKPMSASEEKMMEDAITLANEVTATRNRNHSQSQSPPASPGVDKGAPEYPPDTDHPPSLISKLKNSIRRSPKNERKRTFSDDRPPKAEADDGLAQEAYNALVVRGADRHAESDRLEPCTASNDSVFADPSEPAPLTGSGRSSVSRSGMPQPPPRPLPKPRLDIAAKTEPPVPKPRPEIVQRVEPTIRRPPDSPEPPPVKEKESHIPLPAFGRDSSGSKDREREQLKRSIEIVRVESPTKEAAPLPTIQLDNKESTPEPDSDSTRRSSASEGADSCKTTSLLFDEDFNEPSPREIMSKLARESRMRRNLDHQRVLSGENQDSQASAVTRAARREPCLPPAKSAPEDGPEEVDTNPLRMLRGGAIPLRTSRGAGNSPAKALRYPKLTFHSGGGDPDPPAPKLPPRSPSIRGGEKDADVDAPAPDPPQGGGDSAPCVPPRTPLRQLSMPALNSRPRERRNPLSSNKASDSPAVLTRSLDAAASSPANPTPAFARSVSLHDRPSCPPSHPPPPAPARLRPLPLPLPASVDVGVRPDVSSHDYYGVDETALDRSVDRVFTSSRRALPPAPDSPVSKQLDSACKQLDSVSTQLDKGRKFAPHRVQCSLEQLGFFNQHDPFWVQSVRLPELNASAHDSTVSSEELSPLLLVSYKNSDNVSYEDLLDFGMERQKNSEEVETLERLLDNEVSNEECWAALEETRWDMGQAVKYIRLKQLLSLHLADVHTCKRALMSRSWDVHRAADHLLSLQRSLVTPDDPASPESLDV